jgi:prolipoprotein diacylglyceryltransferase
MIAVTPVSADHSNLSERPDTHRETSVRTMQRLTSLPSPSTGVLELGPLNLSAYGFIIALGAIAGTWLLGRRLEQRGWGTKDDASAIAMTAVPAGLGIWGGVVVGVLAGLWVAKRRGLDVANTFTAVAPALPLAQAIGRWGNWFNQELFGHPTTLPWGLEIDAKHIPDGYELGTLFHPTFLYESLGNLVLVVLLLQIERRRNLRPGMLFLCYTAGYSFLRFFVEGLRIDPAKSGGGLRLNQWTSLALFTTSVVLLIVMGRKKAVTQSTATQSTADAQPTPPEQSE